MSLDVLAPALRHLSRPGTNDITIGVAAVGEWPDGILDALLKARIFSVTSTAQCTICPGCTRGCPMEVGRLNSSNVIVCDKPEDYGIIDVDYMSLRQWRCARSGLIEFLAIELGLRPKSADTGVGLIRFGTSRRLGKPIALDFSAIPQLMIGDDRHDLADLLVWNGHRIGLDWALLQLLTDQATVTVSGGKQYQPSTNRREYRKRLTILRDQEVQTAMDKVRSEHPKWNKERCAREIEKSEKFKSVTWKRIMRVSRVRK